MLSYQFRFNWRFTLCLSLLTSSLLCLGVGGEIPYCLCSVRKALKLHPWSRKLLWLLSSLHSFWNFYVSYFYHYSSFLCCSVKLVQRFSSLPLTEPKPSFKMASSPIKTLSKLYCPFCFISGAPDPSALVLWFAVICVSALLCCSFQYLLHFHCSD